MNSGIVTDLVEDAAAVAQFVRSMNTKGEDGRRPTKAPSPIGNREVFKQRESEALSSEHASYPRHSTGTRVKIGHDDPR